MRGSAFIAFFGIATAISGALVGCGDDSGEEAAAPAKIAKSGPGETCTRSDDCDTGLACFGNTCLEEPSGTGGTNGTGGTAQSLGREGETCTKRTDCNPPLGCFSARCASAGTGEGGGGNTPTQGSRGETCVVSSDCETPLVCLPSAGGFVGVCTDGDSDVAPTGDVCGAECTSATDCCELPVDLHASLGAKSCADLADLIGTSDCAAATGMTVVSQLCFAQATYCDCARNTWVCNDGLCAYNLDCSVDGLFKGGCPTLSRGGHPLPFTCDTADTNTCAPTAVCTTEDDCVGLAVVDDGTDTCTAGECTCYQSNCYRKCDAPLDCRSGYDCDSGGTDLCMPQDACTQDVTCQRQRGDVRARCVGNVCTVPCETDLDCNPNGLINGRFNQVCNADNMCEPIGCTQDADCGMLGGVHVFCGPPVPAAGTFQSAITD